MAPPTLPDLECDVSGLAEDDPLQAVWWHHLRVWLAWLRPGLPAPLRATAYSLALTLCDDAEISALNSEWRGLAGPTDVLAFAAQEAPVPLPLALTQPEPDQPEPERPETEPERPEADAERPEAEPERPDIWPLEGLPLELGDIVISLETARRQAEAEGHSLSRELLFLASHGLLHLLGWDHPDDTALEAMLAQQDALLGASAHLPDVAVDPCVRKPAG